MEDRVAMRSTGLAEAAPPAGGAELFIHIVQTYTHAHTHMNGNEKEEKMQRKSTYEFLIFCHALGGLGGWFESCLLRLALPYQRGAKLFAHIGQRRSGHVDVGAKKEKKSTCER